MQKVDIQNPSERKKLILAGLLGIVSIIFLWWAFFGFGSNSKKASQRNAGQPAPSAITRTTTNKVPPQTRVSIDTNELPTRYLGPQQLSATVPAAVIANPGGRQVILRSPDGTLYSNTATLNVAAPPTPNYIYVGIIGTVRHIDTAILQDKGN